MELKDLIHTQFQMENILLCYRQPYSKKTQHEVNIIPKISVFFFKIVLSKVPKVLFITSIYPSVWRWEVVENKSLILNLPQNFFQKWLSNFVITHNTSWWYMKSYYLPKKQVNYMANIINLFKRKKNETFWKIYQQPQK